MGKYGAGRGLDHVMVGVAKYGAGRGLDHVMVGVAKYGAGRGLDHVMGRYTPLGVVWIQLSVLEGFRLPLSCSCTGFM